MKRIHEALCELPFAMRRPTLLVVDDQSVIIRSLHQLFRNDCEVLMATNGEQAIALCREQKPDLVLLDVVMPGLDGREVCRRLKSDPATQDIAVIFITANQSDEDETIGFELGAVDFITKPINPRTVFARVRTHLAVKIQGDVLRAISLTDGLTDVANRRKFDDELQRAWRKCLREKVPLSLLIADIDHFKRYNDAYGHAEGDTCLRTVAQAMRGALRRPGDSFARYGGEEFACVLPGSSAQSALTPAQRMLDAVAALGIPHRDSPSAGVVTVSVGVATMVPSNDCSAAELVAAADRQLYRAKADGRACWRAVDLGSCRST